MVIVHFTANLHFMVNLHNTVNIHIIAKLPFTKRLSRVNQDISGIRTIKMK